MSPSPDIESIRAALRHVADPEIGANIVDLGLVYSIAFDDKLLRVEMTMTSPACPMGDMILDDAYAELARVLADPAPNVLLTQFADSSINLELGFWIEDPESGKGNVLSEVNLAIWKLFREHGIEIPFPQRDVRIIGTPPAA